jgi:hypothetical protein
VRAVHNESSTKKLLAQSQHARTRASWSATANIAPMGGFFESVDVKRNRDEPANLIGRADLLQKQSENKEVRAKVLRERQAALRRQKKKRVGE